jgi:S-adenosylmethionine synthetase
LGSKFTGGAMIKNGLFTSESVTEGHPDKLCDQISDAVLDAVLAIDPHGRVACEALAGKDFIVVTGEISFHGDKKINYDRIVRDVIKHVGYTKEFDFDPETCEVIIKINHQSRDIAQGVDINGAGDQGMVFGFAINETPEKMPLPIFLAHKITKRLSQVRKNGEVDFLGPDGKAQVTLYYEHSKPVYIDSIVVSTQHKEGVSQEELKSVINEKVIYPTLPQEFLLKKPSIYINPTGKFVIGGPMADTGLTGRKIIVDTYGGFSRHGGGAFSGKDATKVDRSAAYMARYLAKNIVASGLAKICEIQIAYVIGVEKPVSLYIDTFMSGKIPDTILAQKIEETIDLSPSGIIKRLGLNKPIFFKTAVYGHFGREESGFSWEKEDLVPDLRKQFAL